jgi:nitrate reductase gamma subunit
VNPPLQVLLLVALPYAALVVFIAGLIWRYRQRFTISSLSSQFLESRWLAWGAVPFHLGVAVLFAGHLAPLIIPSIWLSWMSNRSALLLVETAGSAAAILCLLGLVMLFIRRLASRAVLRNSTAVDLIVLLMLITQVTLGLAVAMMHRWGAVWSVRTTTPYLWSLITFQPDPSLVAGVPTLMTLHLTGAWIVLALIPFTRLVHMFAVPLHYLHRPPQKVIWLRG